jgi:serine/threonine protein kinase
MFCCLKLKHQKDLYQDNIKPSIVSNKAEIGYNSIQIHLGRRMTEIGIVSKNLGNHIDEFNQTWLPTIEDYLDDLKMIQLGSQSSPNGPKTPISHTYTPQRRNCQLIISNQKTLQINFKINEIFAVNSERSNTRKFCFARLFPLWASERTGEMMKAASHGTPSSQTGLTQIRKGVVSRFACCKPEGLYLASILLLSQVEVSPEACPPTPLLFRKISAGKGKGIYPSLRAEYPDNIDTVDTEPVSFLFPKKTADTDGCLDKEAKYNKCPIKGGFLPVGREQEWKIELDKFQEYLNKENREVHDVEGDGNCFFYAVSDQVKHQDGDGPSHKEYRQMVATHLRNHKSYYQIIAPHEDIDKHCDAIAKDFTWVDHLDIQILSDAMNWEIEILVRSSETQEFNKYTITPAKQENRDMEIQVAKRIYILFSSSFQHYMSACKRNSNPSDLEKKFFERFYHFQELGKGSHGEVRRAFDNVENRFVAIKSISRAIFEENQLESSFNAEIEFLKQIKHENIIELIDYGVIGDCVHIIYELCNEGTLTNKLQNGNLTEEQSITIFLQLLSAFKLIQEQGIIHRDVKPDNILFQNGICKIADFGLCLNLNKINDDTQFGGTIKYSAPEIFHCIKHDFKSDIWSLGVILFEMLFGPLPMDIMDASNAYKNWNLLLPPNDKTIMVSESSRKLIERMLIKEPIDRISWHELFTYKFASQLQQSVSLSLDQELPKEGNVNQTNEDDVSLKKKTRKQKVEKGKREQNKENDKSGLWKQTSLKSIFEDKKDHELNKPKQESQEGRKDIIEETEKHQIESEQQKGKTENKKKTKQKESIIFEGELKNMLITMWNERRPTEYDNMRKKLTEMENKYEDLTKMVNEDRLNLKQIQERIVNLENRLKTPYKTCMEDTEGKMEILDAGETSKEKNLEKLIQENMDLQTKMDKKIKQIEENIQKFMNSDNRTMGNKVSKFDIQSIENSIKGINIKVAKLTWESEKAADEKQNIQLMENRISNLEGWKMTTVQGINNKMIPAIAKNQRQIQWLQKRVENYSKWIGPNKYIYDENGQQENIRFELLGNIKPANEMQEERGMNLGHIKKKVNLENSRSRNVTYDFGQFHDASKLNTQSIPFFFRDTQGREQSNQLGYYRDELWDGGYTYAQSADRIECE